MGPFDKKSVGECVTCAAPLVGNKSGITQMGMDFCNAICRDRTDARAQARIEQMTKFNGGGFRELTQDDYGYYKGRKTDGSGFRGFGRGWLR